MKSNIEEKLKIVEHRANSMRNTLKEKDDELNKLRVDREVLENYRMEQPIIERKISDLTRQKNTYKREIEYEFLIKPQ